MTADPRAPRELLAEALKVALVTEYPMDQEEVEDPERFGDFLSSVTGHPAGGSLLALAEVGAAVERLPQPEGMWSWQVERLSTGRYYVMADGPDGYSEGEGDTLPAAVAAALEPRP